MFARRLHGTRYAFSLARLTLGTLIVLSMPGCEPSLARDLDQYTPPQVERDALGALVSVIVKDALRARGYSESVVSTATLYVSWDTATATVPHYRFPVMADFSSMDDVSTGIESLKETLAYGARSLGLQFEDTSGDATVLFVDEIEVLTDTLFAEGAAMIGLSPRSISFVQDPGGTTLDAPDFDALLRFRRNEELKLAADAGVPYAQFLMGLSHTDGSATPEDVLEAFVWIARAASNSGGETNLRYSRMRDLLAEQMSETQRREANDRLSENPR